MVFCDPPYNVGDYEGKTAKKLKIGNDALGGKFYEFLRDALRQHPGRHQGRDLHLHVLVGVAHALPRLHRAGGHWSTFVIWAKNHFTLGRSDYQRQYEPILYGWRKGTDTTGAARATRETCGSIKRPAANGSIRRSSRSNW